MWMEKKALFYLPQNLILSAKFLSSPEIRFIAEKTRLSCSYLFLIVTALPMRCTQLPLWHWAVPVELVAYRFLSRMTSKATGLCSKSSSEQMLLCHLLGSVMTTWHFGGLKSINKMILIRGVTCLNMLDRKKMRTGFLFYKYHHNKSFALCMKISVMLKYQCIFIGLK